MNIFNVRFEDLLAWAWGRINQGENPLVIARSCIDRIDREIIKLLSLRYEIINKIVVAHKKENGLPFRDRAREGDLLKKLIEFAETTELPPVMVLQIYRPLIDAFVGSEIQSEPDLSPIARHCHRCNVNTCGIVILEEPNHRVCPICKDPLF